MKKLHSALTFGVAASALCISLLTPNWKTPLLAGTGAYANPVYHFVFDVKQTTIASKCGKNATGHQMEVYLYDDNSVQISVSDSNISHLSGSWFTDPKGSYVVALDGENDFVDGSTKSIGALFSGIEQNTSAICGVPTLVIDPSMKTTFVIKTKGDKAKVSFNTNGYQLLDTQTTPYKVKHKVSGSGVSTSI